jgi:RNA polymerase sigma-70 factor (ECF subfamily)
MIMATFPLAGPTKKNPPSAGNKIRNTRFSERSVEDMTDEMLMAAISAGDPDALGALFDRYGGVIKSVVMKTLHNEAESEDLLQEVFVEVWNRADKFSEKKGKPLGWIVTMARRRAIDKVRSRSAYQRATDRFQAEIEENPNSGVFEEDEDIALNDLRILLNAKLEELPVAQREVVELAFYKGMSQREIAAYTNTPLGTIKTRIELGLKKLHAALNSIRDEI